MTSTFEKNGWNLHTGRRLNIIRILSVQMKNRITGNMGGSEGSI